MKFKVGDKVRIREELEVENVYDCFRFTGGMRQYKNKIATITDLCYFYDLDIDNNRFCWTDEMLEPVQEDIIEYNGKKYDVDETGWFEWKGKDYTRLLLLEHKEEILDNAEKKYLKNVIRPFKDEIKSIKKKKFKSKECIRFETNRDDEEYFELLSFPNNSMYKGMKLDEPYTLEIWGLEE